MTSQHAILTAEAHRDLAVRTDHGPAYGDAQMCCITVPSEFRAVQGSYPILFRLNDTRDHFTALAMFGFENGENLFLEDGVGCALSSAGDGDPALPDRRRARWRQRSAGSCRSRVAPHRDGRQRRAIVRRTRPTDALSGQMAEQLRSLDEGYCAAPAFFAALQRYDLLEPFTLDVTLDDGSRNRLVGFHIIDEDRLAALDATALADLQAAGHLLPIYMAIASLAHLGDLVARRNHRLSRG